MGDLWRCQLCFQALGNYDPAGVIEGCPKDNMHRLVHSRYKNPSRVGGRRLTSLTSASPVNFRGNLAYYNRTFDFTGLPGFYKNNLGRGNSSVVDDFFNMPNAEQNTGLDPCNHWYTNNGASDIWHFHPSECGDLSQPRAGVEAFGDLSGPPGLYDATIAPTSLYLGSLVFLDEGRLCSPPSTPSLRDSSAHHRTRSIPLPGRGHAHLAAAGNSSFLHQLRSLSHPDPLLRL